MFEIIISFFTTVLDKFVGNALKSDEKRSLVAKELHNLYGLIVEAIKEIESAHSYLNKLLTEGISGPTGDPIISCGNRLAEIANNYLKRIRMGGDYKLPRSLFERISKRPHADIKAIALFDDKLASALIETIYAEWCVYDNLFKIPCFKGDSRGKIEKMEIDFEKLNNLTSYDYLNTTEISALAKATYFDLFLDDKQHVEKLNELFSVSLKMLSDAKDRLGEFIKSNYRIEDLL